MELSWTPAPSADSARLGDEGAPLTDYLLHPPAIPGAPQDVGAEPRLWSRRRRKVRHADPADQRRAALRALIDAAFGP